MMPFQLQETRNPGPAPCPPVPYPYIENVPFRLAENRFYLHQWCLLRLRHQFSLSGLDLEQGW